jgi:integrase/recombinase XerD
MRSDGPHPDVEAFLTTLLLERGRSANTLAAYRRDLERYEAWLWEQESSIEAADDDLIVRHLDALAKRELAAASRRRAAMTIRSFHRWRTSEGITGGTVGRDLAMPRVTDAVPKALSEEQIVRVLGACVGVDPTGYRDRAILEVLYGTGMRISELVGLQLSAVDLDDGMARVFGKGSKERLVPLAGYAMRALVEYLGPPGRPRLEPERWARRGDADAVFLNSRGGRLSRQGAWLIVQGYADTAGLGDVVHPHVFRHSCATHMIEHGADIRTVQELLGHASLSTTQRYTRVTTERLRAVFAAAHPRATLEREATRA